MPLWWVLAALSAPALPWLDLEQCPELDAQLLRDLTVVEAGTRPTGASASVACNDAGFVVSVTVDGAPAATRTIERTTAMGEVPERYLAVELGELLSAVDTPPPATPPAPEHPTARPQPKREPRGFVFASARAEIGGSPMMAAGGGSVALGGRVLRHLSLRADVTGLGAGRRVRPDAIRAGALWGSATVLATVDAGPTILHAGAGARVGGLWIRGLPGRDGRSGRLHRGLTWSPQITVGVLAFVRGHVFIATGIDAGWIVRPIRAFSRARSDATLVYANSGPWVAVSLGVGSRFGR